MGCLTIYYLLDAAVSEKEQGIKLTFFSPSKNKWKEILDTGYRPYFFIQYPIPEDDLKVIQELGLGISVVEKTDLFTRKTVKLTRIDMNDFSDPLQLSRNFSKSWEKEVHVVSSYMYDNNLVFGAQYKIKGKEIVPLLGVSKKDLKTFKKAFSEIRKTDPEKYKLSKRLFILCSQPVPEVSLKRFGIRKKVDSEELYLMFMLARLTNLPVPKAFRNRQVSTWIKSILHNYLRKNNILIPTSKELRRGEKTHSVKGALTLTPEPGVHFNTVVVDFDSMYPSLIDSYNLSHETIDCADDDCQSNKVPELDHYVCTKRRGVYSILIGSLKDLRIHWFKPRSKDKALSDEKRSLAEATSQLLKLILVSSYGVVIRIHGLSRSSLGESITAYGRYSLRTAKLLSFLGFKPTEVRKNIEKAYLFRNKVSHGMPISKKEAGTIEELKTILDYLRLSLIIFISLSKIKKNEFVHLVDSALIDINSSLKLNNELQEISERIPNIKHIFKNRSLAHAEQ